MKLSSVVVRHLLLAVCLGTCLPAGVAWGQQPLNLGFELSGFSKPNVPRDWSFQSIVGVSLDTIQPKSGRRSLRLHTDGSEELAGMNILPGKLTKGKRVTFAGWIRTEDIYNGHAGLSISYGTSRGMVADSAQVHDATSPWTRYEVTLQVDSAADGVILTVGQNGTGTGWFDDMQLTIDGKEYTVLPPLEPPPSAEQVAWIKQRAIPFKTVQPSNDVSDLSAVGDIVGDARLVELGEGTHGTRDFFQMKQRMLQYLVEKKGFTIFGIEANQLATAQVAEYIRTGKGNPIDAMSGLFKVWKTYEVLAMIEWVRHYNASVPAAKRIEFVGYDMQDPSVPMDSVVAFLTRVDPAYAQTASSAYQNQRDAWRKVRYPQRSMEIRKTWVTGAKTVLDHVRAQLPDYEKHAGHGAAMWAEQNANVVYQAASLTLESAANTYRDSAMAANIDWTVRQNPDRKMIVWAHNAHVSRQAGAMGSFLTRNHPNDMRVFGLATYAGQYTGADDIVHRNYGTITDMPAPIGSVEEGLHRADIPRFIIDLRPAKTTPAGSWLTELREMRGIGFEATDYGFGMETVTDGYDALVFIDRSGASVSLPDSGVVVPLAVGKPKAYLDSVMTLMNGALLRGKVDWPALRSEAYDRTRGAKTTADTYDAIRNAISRIGDHHTFFVLPARTAAMHNQTATSNPQPVVRSIGAGLGYVMLPAFSGDKRSEMDKYAATLQRHIAEVDSTSNPCGWIVDLRQNGGGNMWPMLAGIGPILGDGVAGGFVSPSNERVEYKYQNGRAIEGPHVLAQTIGAPYHLKRGQGPVAVLTSGRTASSGEAILVGFRGRPNTRTFGTASGGFTTANDVYQLSDGAMLVLTESVYVDRTGLHYGDVIPPDVTVTGDAAAVSGDDDAVMTAASSWLKSLPACRAQ